MRKSIFAIVASIMVTTSVGACPAWECQLMIDDWSCGGVHCQSSSSGGYIYDENSVRQPIYCQYCGNEMWACTCGTYVDNSYDTGCTGYEETYDSSCSTSGSYIYDDYTDYSGCGYSEMDHWANVRDECGNIIGQIGCGSSVEVIGNDCDNPDRVMVYDASTGLYGSVLRSCVYGGYAWDGTGDNGAYNAYQGYSGEACSYNSGCVEPSYCNYVRYTEAISIVRQWEAMTGACHTVCW